MRIVLALFIGANAAVIATGTATKLNCAGLVMCVVALAVDIALKRRRP